MSRSNAESHTNQDGTQFREFLEKDELYSKGVMGHVFGIKRHETASIWLFAIRPQSTAGDPSDGLDRHTSSVRRALVGLAKSELVECERHLLSRGGRTYRYTAVPIEDVRQFARNQFEHWVENICEETHRN